MADKKDLLLRQIMVGRVARLREDGFSTIEIAEKLNVPESTVRSCIKTINDADANRTKNNIVG